MKTTFRFRRKKSSVFLETSTRLAVPSYALKSWRTGMVE